MKKQEGKKESQNKDNQPIQSTQTLIMQFIVFYNNSY